jgi:hypothetical protein
MDGRIQTIEVIFQSLLGLGTMLEWSLDGPFTRDEIPLIHRVKKTTCTKPGGGFRFVFAHRSHEHLTMISISLGTIQH